MLDRPRPVSFAPRRWHVIVALGVLLLSISNSHAATAPLTAFEQDFCAGYSEFKLDPTPVVFPHLSESEIQRELFGASPPLLLYYRQYFQRAMLLLFRQDHLTQAEMTELWLRILDRIYLATGEAPMNYDFVASDGTQVFHNGANGRVLLIRTEGEIFRFRDPTLQHLSPGWQPDFALYDPANGTDLVRREEEWGALALELNIPTPEFSVLEEMLDLPTALPLLNSPDSARTQGRLKAQAEEILQTLPEDSPHRQVLRRRLGEILWRYGVDLG